jgi:hypothetical protein
MVKHSKSFLYLILKKNHQHVNKRNWFKYIQNLKITKPLGLLLGSWQVEYKIWKQLL